ncbi:MAG: hypothetical protein JXQ23_01855 [Clostridia bacterium]|nr:hypothetical protein [Clostridia bacterium]
MKIFTTRKFFAITTLILLCIVIASVAVVASNTLAYREKCTKIENEKRELVNEKIMINNDLYIARNDIKALEEKAIADEISMNQMKDEWNNEIENLKKMVSILSTNALDYEKKIESLNNEIKKIILGQQGDNRIYVNKEFQYTVEFTIDYPYLITDQTVVDDENRLLNRGITIYLGGETGDAVLNIWGSNDPMSVEDVTENPLKNVSGMTYPNNFKMDYTTENSAEYEVVLKGVVNDYIGFFAYMSYESYINYFDYMQEILLSIKLYS